jgi:hypothetical protein
MWRILCISTHFEPNFRNSIFSRKQVHFPYRKRGQGSSLPPPETTPLKARACGARTLVRLRVLIPAPTFHTEKDVKKETHCAENTLREK